MKKKYIIDCIVIGFATFAIFFGAGNLIFPPHIGLFSGENWSPALIGFLLTGVCLPALGIIAVGFAGNSMKALTDKVHPIYTTILGGTIILTIGPLIFIPRTASTSFELSVLPFFPVEDFKYVFLIAYFALALLFSIKESKVVDYVGRILTPLLLIILLVIIFVGVFSPIEAVRDTTSTQGFIFGFTSGYQTADALASIIFATIVFGAIKARNYETRKVARNAMFMSVGIAAFCLAVIYSGLLYVGSTSNFAGAKDLEMTEFVIAIIDRILGIKGTVLFSFAVCLACLTTAIGLTSAVGKFVQEITNNKIKYSTAVYATIAVSVVIASLSVKDIVQYSKPILSIVYPQVMFLIISTLIFRNKIGRLPYIFAAIATFVSTIPDAILSVTDNVFMANVRSFIPFGDDGFAWAVPCIAAFFLGYLLSMYRDSQKKIPPLAEDDNI